MANYTVDPNMGFKNPVPSTDPGPDYANNITSALTTIGAHTHLGDGSTGQQLTQQSLNITGDLSMNVNNITNIRSVRLSNLSGAISGVGDIGCIYEVNNELWYNSGNGTQQQITLGGALNVGGLSNQVFSPLAVSGNVTILSTDTFVYYEVNTSAPRTFTLPSASAVAHGRYYIIKDVTGSAASNNITINRAGSDTIEGLTSFVIDGSRGGVLIESNGSNGWNVFPLGRTISGDISSSGSGVNQALTVTNLTGSAGTVSVSATNMSWALGVGSPVLNIAARTTDAATTDLKIQGQYAFASATGTNRSPGAIILDVGAATNSSTTENQVKFSRNGTLIAQIGVGGGGGSNLNTRMWLGSNGGAYTATNYVLISDNNTGVTLNVPSATGTISLLTNNTTSTGFTVMASDGYFGGTTNTAPVVVEWISTTAPVIRGGTNVTTFKIGTNKAGATLQLNGGTGADGGVQIMTTRIAATGGSSAPTLGTTAIGVSSGPATAAQNGWIPIIDSAGNTCWIPVWR